MSKRADLFGPSIIHQDGAAWTPDDVKLPEIGDRVRVNFSAECEMTIDPDSPAGRKGQKSGHAHQWAAQGMTGEVVQPKERDVAWLARSNHFAVYLDNDYEYAGGCWSYVPAAAIELTPIEADEVTEYVADWDPALEGSEYTVVVKR